LKISRQKVDDVIDFTAKYIAGIIKSGSMDLVCIPYFGKFIAKPRQVYHVDRLRAIPKPMYNNNLADPSVEEAGNNDII
jgi:hypothetical protein